MGRISLIIAFGLSILVIAPAQSAGSMNWEMIKFKGLRTVHLESYPSRKACEAQAEVRNRNKDGWKYRCKAR